MRDQKIDAIRAGFDDDDMLVTTIILFTSPRLNARRKRA
jgi:hypothetical protein